MRIALDVDGVLCNFAEPCNHWLASVLGLEPTTIDRWDWYENYKRHVGVSPDEVDRTWRRFWSHANSSAFFSYLPVVPGAQWGVQRLRDAGHEPFFLTARNEGYYRDRTEDWLVRHGFTRAAYVSEHLVMDREKHNHDFDLLIDDRPENVTEVLLQGRRALLFDQPWNKEARAHRRVYGWDHLVTAVSLVVPV